MKTIAWRKTILAGLAALVAASISLFAVGCGGNTPQATLDSADSANWDQYDNANNELPYFGDPEIKALTEDALYTAPQPTPVTDVPSAAANSVFIRVIWGNLIYDPADPGPARDYSGTMTVDDGTLYILRTVEFEDSDYAIPGRTDPKTIAWNSKIRPHYDGLLIRLDPGSTAEASNFLHVQIGVYSKDFSVADLAANFLLLDPTGDPNGPNDHVAMTAHEVNAKGSGFVFGHWRDFDGRVRHGGLFKGKWESDEGNMFGHERVRYWPAEGLARGKYIGDDGVLKGRLHGTFDLNKTASESGTYQIDWYDRTLSTKIGTVDGIYLKKGDVGRGFSMGNWSED